ncbi:MAG: gamma-glutamyltransferase family protein [Jatrophihabitans sp.]|nr:MAG: gamma-glutamyltransferase family protein [Jatrophihabitans sp.]
MFTTRPVLRGRLGMVSSTHWAASAAGMAQLEAGGNAFDAAVSAGFALQVLEPHLNGPGGDLPAIFAGPGRSPTVLCAQGVAPAGATIAHLRDLGFALVPGSGPLAAVVPGATAGWLTLLRDHGTRRLRDVLDAAIGYAADGVTLLPAAIRAVAAVADLFRDDWTTSAALYLPGGRVPTPGSWHRNPAWAAVLQRLLAEAEAATADRDGQIGHALRSWRHGFVADAIGRFGTAAWRDSSGKRHAGVLTAADIAAWRPTYEPPVTFEFRGWTVCKTAAWGQGPVLLQQLALLDGFELEPGTAGFVHTVVEAAKLAFADREAWYGDPPGGTPLPDLLGEGYTAGRRHLITDTASGELRPGSPGGRPPRLPRAIGAGRADGTSGEPTSRTGPTTGDTCHVCVADRSGNLVAATPSGGWLQSSPAIPELGFALGTRLQMTWLQEGLPSSLAPGRRPRTTLSPTLVLRDGEPRLAFGTPGGDQQDQWQLGFFLNHVVAGMDLQAAIDAPAFHTTHFPSSFYPREANPRQVVVESRIGSAVIAELRRRGHEVVVADPWSLGRMCVVANDGESLSAAANPRGMQGYAVGR